MKITIDNFRVTRRQTDPPLLANCGASTKHVLNPGLYPSLVALAINSYCMDSITEIKNHTFF